jgi:hypothetical protein
LLYKPVKRLLKDQTEVRRPSHSRDGFAVVMALGLMSAILILLLTVTILSQVELRAASNSLQRLAAKENARLGMLVALGNLQRFAGPDQRVTAIAEGTTATTPGSARWLGIWDGADGGLSPIGWLVSGGEPDPTLGAEGIDSTTVFPEVGDEASVVANWISIPGRGDSKTGQFAFWVEDESLKAKININPAIDSLDYQTDPTRSDYLTEQEARQDVGESIRIFPNQEKIFAELNPDPATSIIPLETVEALSRIISREQVNLVLDDPDLADQQHHSYSVHAASVLENPRDGGLKTNLTGISEAGIELLLNEPGKEGDLYLSRDFLLNYNIDPETGEKYATYGNPNNPDPRGPSLTAAGELISIPTEDFYEFRDSDTSSDDGEVSVIRNIMPVVSEASFRLGAFHTQTDTKHRIRFHADVEFWNPYPFPIRFPGEGSNRCFTVMLVPSQFGTGGRGRNASDDQLILSVQKIAPGRGRGGTIESELHTNLFDFDEELGSVLGGGSTNNTINETVMNSWMVIDDVVLQPGEVYHATTEKTDGLARDLGGYVLSSGGDREDASDYEVDPDHHYNKWSWHTTQNPTHPIILEPDDRIEIDLRIPTNGLTMRLIQFHPSSQSRPPVYEEESNEWAEPVFEIRHLYKGENPPTLVLSGDEYSRYSSGSYTEDNYNIGFHYRLDDEAIMTADPDATALTQGFDLRQPVWDYDNPAVKKLVMVGGVFPEEALGGVEPDPFDTQSIANLFYDGVDILADFNPDTHSGSYEEAILFQAPAGEPLSVGSFKNLPLSYETVDYDVDDDGEDESVQLTFGSPWGGTLNQAFDRYFFTGAPVRGWEQELPLPVPAKILASATNENLRARDAARHLLIEGGFNINSLSEEAWAAVLSHSFRDWRFGTNQTTDLKNAFLNLGFSTDNAVSLEGSLIEDETFTQFETSDWNAQVTAGRIAMRYPLRRLSDEQLYNPDTEQNDSLVEYIVSGLRERLASSPPQPPFSSLSEFIDSGILDRAIRESGINGQVARFSPAYICQSKMLEAIAPFLKIRGDTFVIHGLGNYSDPLTGEAQSSVVCRAVVQRLPNRVDGDETRITELSSTNGNAFGRQFVILNMSWEETVQ